MKKILIICITLLTFFKITYAQKDYNFRGLLYQQDYAIYGYVNYNNTQTEPKKIYVFIEDKEAPLPAFNITGGQPVWKMYDSIEIPCGSFTIKVPVKGTAKIMWGDIITAEEIGNSNGSSGAVPMARPADASEDANRIIDEFEYKEPIKVAPVTSFSKEAYYSYEQLKASIRIQDEIEVAYGKTNILPLSKGMYADYKGFLSKRDQKFSDFLIQSEASTFEKAVLLQNQMNLFFTPGELVWKYGESEAKRILGRVDSIRYDEEPRWQTPLWCDTNKLRELMDYMIYQGKCTGGWQQIYDCMILNQDFEKAFDAYVKSIYPEYVNYRKTCVIDKYAYEYEECQCIRTIELDGGFMSYWHRDANNSSISGLMPWDNNLTSNGVRFGGGIRNWSPNTHPSSIGNNPYQWRENRGSKTHFDYAGNNMGIYGWDMLRGQTEYGTCDGYFQKYYSKDKVDYFEKSITYGCVNEKIDLVENCACPIAVRGAVKYLVDMSANSKCDKACTIFVGSNHSGKLNHIATAFLAKSNLHTTSTNPTVLFDSTKIIDAGQSMVWSECKTSVNKDFFYSLTDFAWATIKAASNFTDTSLFQAIRAGINLAFTRVNYDSTKGGSGTFMLLDKDFGFMLYPNEEARLKIVTAWKGLVEGEDAGWTELIQTKKFLASFYSGASRNNVCCNPAFISNHQGGMSLESNAIFNRLTFKGGSTEPWDYSHDKHINLWGAQNDAYCNDKVIVVYSTKSTPALSPKDANHIELIDKKLHFSQMLSGDYHFEITDLLGRQIVEKPVQISEPHGTIQFDEIQLNGFYIIRLYDKTFQFSKKVHYEK